MIGIDIVDLQDPQLKIRSSRSLRLISHPEDQLMEHPQSYWLLWAAKEAIFKCQREAINFSPKQISVQLSQNSGTISFTSGTLSGKLEICSAYVVAICAKELAHVAWEIVQTDGISTSDSVRNEIRTFFKGKDIEIEITSDPLNLPVLMPHNEPVSISHHRNWSAFAYPKSITS